VIFSTIAMILEVLTTPFLVLLLCHFLDVSFAVGRSRSKLTIELLCFILWQWFSVEAARFVLNRHANIPAFGGILPHFTSFPAIPRGIHEIPHLQ
jgi:hypothetical protein